MARFDEINTRPIALAREGARGAHWAVDAGAYVSVRAVDALPPACTRAAFFT